MRLPVIQTCGECGWAVDQLPGGTICGNSASWTPVAADHPPPSWCPLRTGPDAERIAALEAVASAARALAEAWKTEESEPTSVVLDRVQSAEDVLVAALRSLT